MNLLNFNHTELNFYNILRFAFCILHRERAKFARRRAAHGRDVGGKTESD